MPWRSPWPGETGSYAAVIDAFDRGDLQEAKVQLRAMGRLLSSQAAGAGTGDWLVMEHRVVEALDELVTAQEEAAAGRTAVAETARAIVAFRDGMHEGGRALAGDEPGLRGADPCSATDGCCPGGSSELSPKPTRSTGRDPGGELGSRLPGGDFGGSQS